MTPDPAAVVNLGISIEAPPPVVWQALVDPDLGPRWMGGFRFVSEWVVGGPMQIAGTLNGKPYRETGTLLALEPGRALTYSHWSRLWRVPDAPANRAVLTLSVDPTPTGCQVSLRHVLPEVEAIAEHSTFFWTVALDQLRRLVEPPEPR